MASSKSTIQDDQILSVIYPTDPKHSIFNAIGICKVELPPNDPRLKEKCAFSQYPLSECAVSAIAVAVKSSNGSKQQGNQWKYLCDSDFSKVHLFDAEYLKTWMQMKGCEFIQCPLCKSGSDEKEQIEEHEIESMEQLRDRRTEAKSQSDLYLQFHIEQLIVDKACTLNVADNSIKQTLHSDVLREVLNNWISKRKIAEFRSTIVESTLRAVECDNVIILKIICKYCDYEIRSVAKSTDRNKEYMDFINCAARNASFDCITLLLAHSDKLDWSREQRPRVLLNAVREHPENLELAHFVMTGLETVGICFVCDDVMEQCIKFDLVDIAKRIVNNRWHKLTDKDTALAQSINLRVNSYFKERASAFNFNKGFEDDGLGDDDWGDGGDDDEFDEDDDWENAMDEDTAPIAEEEKTSQQDD